MTATRLPLSTPAGWQPTFCVGILLAAGSGLRFQAASPAARGTSKLLVPLLDGRPVAAASAGTLLAALPQVTAVVPTGASVLRALLTALGCTVLEAPDAPRGLGVSLATAARHLLARYPDPATAPACIVALADMPWLRPSTLATLAQHVGPSRIVAPVYQGRRGHPVVFGTRFLPELATLHGDSGARSLLVHHGVLEIECDDDGVLRDVDTPTDLDDAKGPAV